MTDIANIVAKMQSFFGAGTTGQVLTSRGPGRTWNFQDLPVVVDAGKIVQHTFFEDSEVATGTGTVPEDDTTPQITEGTQFMSITHTPLNAANFIYIFANLYLNQDNNFQIATSIHRVGVSNALYTMAPQNSAANFEAPLHLRHRELAGVITPITYTVRCGAFSGTPTITFNGRAGARLYGPVPKSNMMIWEFIP